MNSYEKTLITVAEVKTINAHMVSLGKIRATSEDQELGFYIASLVLHLQQQQQQLGQMRQKSIPTSLTFYPTYEVSRLVQYCQYQLASSKPEWQILAERHGWIRPGQGV
ncbi:hypothetical protein [Silanimonas sp.]|jgi:hypothetical protein|uniref:hypothetical protein n=1 Tax=Silanimonas sp. TaxID=1929290 RepID=UPI0022BCE77D|nr:hypothetical protein [Silanimonas sp.]MCZ8164981.1 hypothetical protein [Silanimonas sp.]